MNATCRYAGSQPVCRLDVRPSLDIVADLRRVTLRHLAAGLYVAGSHLKDLSLCRSLFAAAVLLCCSSGALGRSLLGAAGTISMQAKTGSAQTVQQAYDAQVSFFKHLPQRYPRKSRRLHHPTLCFDILQCEVNDAGHSVSCMEHADGEAICSIKQEPSSGHCRCPDIDASTFATTGWPWHAALSHASTVTDGGVLTAFYVLCRLTSWLI